MCGQPAAQTIALVGATVIDGAGGPRLENAVILIEGDRLACVGTAEAPLLHRPYFFGAGASP